MSDAEASATSQLSAIVQKYFPSGIEPKREHDSLICRFPEPVGADYQFQATIFDEGDPHILSARLLVEPDAYF